MLHGIVMHYPEARQSAPQPSSSMSSRRDGRWEEACAQRSLWPRERVRARKEGRGVDGGKGQDRPDFVAAGDDAVFCEQENRAHPANSSAGTRMSWVCVADFSRTSARGVTVTDTP